jgi:hypothetical protein
MKTNIEQICLKYRHLRELREYMNLAMQEANAFEDVKQGFENKHGTNSLGFKERSIWKAHSSSNFLGTTLKCVRNMHS